MKRFIFAFVLSISVFGMMGCKHHTSEPEQEPGSSLYEMISVITNSTTVIGQDPLFVESGAEDKYKGVFRTGRNVTISPYSIGKYEVTQELYKMIMDGESVNGTELESEPSYCKETGTYPLIEGEIQNKRPVEGVTWYDAVYFCNAFTEKILGPDNKVYSISDITVDSEGHITDATVTMDRTKTGYRLPTEAEWELAARGGDPSKADWNYMFSGCNKASGTIYSDTENTGMDSVGWYRYNTGNGGVTGNTMPLRGTAGYGTHEIGKKEHNRLGIYDMSGNVAEFCWDWRADSVETGDVTDPLCATPGLYRVCRGGTWFNEAFISSVCYRGYDLPFYCYDWGGFRLVRSRSK